ncbi:hypothetical protein BD413DRAFT_623228 [Trametes elegans]|nr:hypothetical protein BD413DRAFT_623228 [Trametes elegans]
MGSTVTAITLTSRIGDGLSRPAWALWRCFPSSLRLAFCHRLEQHYGDASRGLRMRLLPFGLVSRGGIESRYIEADNIRSVAKNTSAPVPRVLDAIEYIGMSRVEGEPLRKWMAGRAIRAPEQLPLLEKLALGTNTGNIAGIIETMALLKAKAFPPPTLDLSDAAPLVEDLRRACRELRSLVPPSGALTGLSGRPLRCNRAGGCGLIGPFEDQLEFKQAIFTQASGFRYRHRIPALRRLAAPVHATQRRVVFTHADLAARSVLVEDGRPAGILAREFSGWRPEHWELVAIGDQMRGEPLAYPFWGHRAAAAVVRSGAVPRRAAAGAGGWLLRSTGMTAVVGGKGRRPLSCPRRAQPRLRERRPPERLCGRVPDPTPSSGLEGVRAEGVQTVLAA